MADDMRPSIASRQASMKFAETADHECARLFTRPTSPHDTAIIRGTATSQDRSFFGGPHGDELAFLPAALEIVETPAPPLAGAIGGVIIALFCAGAGLGDRSANWTSSPRRPGKSFRPAEPRSFSPLKPALSGPSGFATARASRLARVLIELDPTMNEAELKHFQSDLVSAELDVARIKAALSEDADPLSQLQGAGRRHRRANSRSTPVSGPAARGAARQVGRPRQPESDKRRPSLLPLTATIGKLEAMLPILQQRVAIRQELYAHETGSKVNYLEILQALVEAQQELQVQKSRAHEAEAACPP